jgi:hypothetical protein
MNFWHKRILKRVPTTEGTIFETKYPSEDGERRASIDWTSMGVSMKVVDVKLIN